MCGITGIYGLSDKNLIKKMTDTLKHRGPDGKGYYIDNNVSLGHRRLSIIDLKTGDQPIYNEDKTLVIIYNGEVYNYKTLKSQLKKSHKFHTASDTEVLLHMYEEEGPNFVEKLDGIFAFAIYDSKKKILLLARDRMGVKPLFYFEKEGILIFGSEIKSILQYSEMTKELDREGLSSYLTFGSVLGENTLIKGIKKILPGHFMIYNGKKPIIKKFFRREIAQKYDDEHIAADKLRKLMKETISSQLMSDVPLGAFLSGGIDSSTVVGLMSQIIDRPVETFTVGFGRNDDELGYSSMVSEHFETNHHELMLSTEEVQPIFSKLIWHFDDPIWDATSVPTFFVSQFARKYVKVVLTGEGADELFAGYNKYNPFSQYFWFVPFSIKKAGYNSSVHIMKSMRKQITGVDSSYSERLQESYFSKRKDLEAILSFEQEQILPNQLLAKVDRASMAVGLEARVPFLGNKIIEFSDSIPQLFKKKGLSGKYLLRKAVENIVPKEIIHRAKQGFAVPILQWFEEKEMLDLTKNVLDKPHINKELVYPPLQKLLSLQGFKPARKAFHLWSLLELEIWYRTFIEHDGSSYLKKF